MIETILDGIWSHCVIEANNRGSDHLAGEMDRVPLPSILGPNSSEAPIASILSNLLLDWAEIELLDSLGNTFCDVKHLSKSLPCVLAIGSISVLGPGSQELAIGSL